MKKRIKGKEGRINSFLHRLISEGIVNKKDITGLVRKVSQEQLSFVTHLIQIPKVDSVYLSKILAEEFLLPFVDLNTIDPSLLPINLVPEEWIKKYEVLPLWRNNEVLGVGMADPSQQSAIEDIRFYTGLAVESLVVDLVQLRSLIDRFKSQPTLSQSFFVGNFDGVLRWQQDIGVTRSLFNDTKEDPLVINYVDKLLIYAISKNVSDIHVEPWQDSLSIRFRIDGLLYPMVSLSASLKKRLVTRFKIMSRLDIAQRQIPQDGRFQVKDIAGCPVDCRLSTCPTLYGEKLVIRILDSKKMLLKIDKLGMDKGQQREFIQALKRPHGMILVTGPTGSGKTVTLYTAINFLKKASVNISTVENPIEIVLAGINQVNVNPATGLDFARVLRAFLRQDPDIIMVGEMRDQETAEIGVKAAQTGHLVLSSLHTNSAVDSVLRLSNLGIPNYNIAASVNLIIAQRLARRLCPDCKVENKLSREILMELGITEAENHSAKIFSEKGCSQCTDGFRGRTGIFEILTITDKVKRLILKNNRLIEINGVMRRAGIQTLYSSALEKLKKGMISLSEMNRIIKD